MDARIQMALDGELGRNELTAEEKAQLAEAESMIRATLRAVPAEPVPDLRQAVMRRIEPLPAYGQRTGRMAWLLQPRPVSLTLRPITGFGLAAAALAFVLLTRSAPVDPAVPVASAQEAVLIQFKLNAPQATQVSLAGDFTEWRPTYEMTQAEPGVWTIVVPLDPGVHDYAFIVDGERWVADPNAPAVDDGFGGRNSRLAVLSPEARAL